MSDHTTGTDNILELTNLTKRFGGLVAVDSVSLQIRRGEVFALIGPNGAGKPTLFNSVTGLFQPTSGSVVFDGVDITGSRPHEVARSGIARTFQNIRLFDYMTAIDNVKVGHHVRMKAKLWDSLFKLPREKKEEERITQHSMELLRFVGIERFAHQYAHNLPYGQQRRLEIARALATDPKLLLLDEPSSGLNVEETDDMAFWIQDIKNLLGITVLMVEHDMKLVSAVSDRVLALNYGKPLAMGTVHEVQAHPEVIRAYLGG